MVNGDAVWVCFCSFFVCGCFFIIAFLFFFSCSVFSLLFLFFFLFTLSSVQRFFFFFFSFLFSFSFFLLLKGRFSILLVIQTSSKKRIIFSHFLGSVLNLFGDAASPKSQFISLFIFCCLFTIYPCYALFDKCA